MALIKCPDCGTEVSDRAPACVKCGAPIAAQPPVSEPHHSAVQTIEQTGKKYKAAQAVGVIASMAGIGMMLMSNHHGTPNTGGLVVTAGGLLVYFFARIGAWWNHE